ncbi:MAG: hypothetical protein LBN07_05020 [Christensenellaceae bacterium]|nr:hypothetical protein [Christensenellaceae bacterium]
MKKLFTVLLVCCVCAVSFVFVGCGEDYSAEQIAEKYDQMKINSEISDMFDAGHYLKISYDSPAINLSVGVTNNPLRIVFDIYEPTLKAASQFLMTKLDDLAAQSSTIFKEFDKDARNSIYKSLDELENELVKFNTVKQRFDRSNGQLLEIYIREYNRLIEKILEVNNIFGTSYYNAFMKKDYTNTATGDLVGPIADAILYGKGVCAEVFFNYYILNITIETPPQSIAKWEAGFMNFSEFKDFAMSQNLGGAVTSTDKTILMALVDGHDEFLQKYEVFKKNLKDVNYKEYYYNTIILNRDRELYLNSLSLMQRSLIRSGDEFVNSAFALFWQRTKSLQY